MFYFSSTDILCTSSVGGTLLGTEYKEMINGLEELAAYVNMENKYII